MKVDVFQKARELGEVMVASDEYKQVQAAEAALNENEEAQALIKRFNDMQATMQEMMQSENPDKDAMSAMAANMRQTQNELTAMPEMQAVNEAQKGFAELLNSVNQVLRFVITGDVGGEQGGCGGNCDSCKGCH